MDREKDRGIGAEIEEFCKNPSLRKYRNFNSKISSSFFEFSKLCFAKKKGKLSLALLILNYEMASVLRRESREKEKIGIALLFCLELLYTENLGKIQKENPKLFFGKYTITIRDGLFAITGERNLLLDPPFCSLFFLDMISKEDLSKIPQIRISNTDRKIDRIFDVKESEHIVFDDLIHSPKTKKGVKWESIEKEFEESKSFVLRNFFPKNFGIEEKQDSREGKREEEKDEKTLMMTFILSGKKSDLERIKAHDSKLYRKIVNFLEDGPGIEKIGTLNKAQEEFKKMSIAITGAREGDIIRGAMKGTQGTVIMVTGDIPPSRKIFNRLCGYREEWETFLEKLGSIYFFSVMTIKMRELWLYLFSVDQDFIDQELPIKILEIGDSKGNILIENLDGEYIQSIMEGETDFQELSKEIVKSTGKSSTLVSLKTFWKLSDYNKMCVLKNNIIDVFSGEFIETSEPVLCLELKDKQIGFLKTETDRKLTPPREGMETFFKLFTPSVHKSLLQKIIRYTPEKIIIDTDEYTPEDVLEQVIRFLCNHPGSFVPNIQKFVSGTTAASKRIAVSVLEDSCVSSPSDILSLLSGAVVSSLIKGWKPGEILLGKWVDIAKGAMLNTERSLLDYKKYSQEPPLKFKKDPSVASSCLLDYLKAFPTDLGLARAYAVQEVKSDETKKGFVRPPYMHFYHCLDHHCMPNIAYYFHHKVVEKICKGYNPKTPFEQLFEKMFSCVTGINPRKIEKGERNYDEKFETRSFVEETRKAQYLVYKSLTIEKIQREFTGGKLGLSYSIDDSWLSGLVGVIKIKRKEGNMIVTLRVDDPTKLVVAREPVSSRKKIEYTPLRAEEEEETISAAIKILEKGVNLNQATSPIEILKNAVLYLKNGVFSIKTENGLFSWDEIKTGHISYSIVEPHIKKDPHILVYGAILSEGNGIEENYEEKLIEILKEQENGVLRRLKTFFAVTRSVISMEPISRTGGGTKLTPNIRDVAVFHVLCQFSLVVPGALSLTKGRLAEFTVKNILLFEKIRELVGTFMEKREKDEKEENGWKPYLGADKREMFYYQKEALEDMKRNLEKGNTGNFLWLPMGSGKTMIMMNYLKWLKKSGNLPKYILYTLPPESLSSIVAELNLFSVPLNLIIPLKTKKTQNVEIKTTDKVELCPYTVNIVFHDHLRRCFSEFEKDMENTIFIIDEVHLFLNQTQRTTTGLNLAKLSKLFVCMTGTPIVDNKIEKLIGWLERMVRFEVNKANFWAAANSMISKEISSGVKTEFADIPIEMSKKELKEYQSLVSSSLGGLNQNPTTEDLLNAVKLCYKICDKKMVSETVSYLEKKRGVMLVAKDSKHQQKLLDSLVEKGVKRKDIFLIESGTSILLTDEKVKKGETDYKVVIVPIKKSQGYTLTRLSVMITCVYPSNSATREQIRGRINRIGQKSKVTYVTIHTGILSRILKHHDHATSIISALKELSKK